MPRPKIVITTSSLLYDRVILYNNFLSELSKKADVYIWPAAWDKPVYANLHIENVHVERFPEIKPMRHWRSLLRRLNDYTWDAKNLASSRKSFWEYNVHAEAAFILLLLRSLGKIVNFLGLANALEKWSEPIYTKENRSPEAYERLKKLAPKAVISMSAFFNIEPGIIVEARKLKIDTLSFITAWDNITTKNRIMFSYEGFFVWSKHMKNDLDLFYPKLKSKPWYIVGAPQYDVFKNPEFQKTRETFCEEHGLDPGLPIVVYALGSPNLFDEFPGALEFVKRAAKGEMGNIQVIVRPHPMKHNDPDLEQIPQLYSKAIVQASEITKKGSVVYTQDKDKIIEWLNTFKHADAIIQLSSTVAIDGALLDRPVINMDFDPSGKKDGLVKDVNENMHHFASLNRLDGMWQVRDMDEMVEAVNGYLKDPSLHREGRKKIAEYVCGFTDGQCGERFAEAIISYLEEADGIMQKAA